MKARLMGLAARFAEVGIVPTDPDDERMLKAILTLWAVLSIFVAALWGGHVRPAGIADGGGDSPSAPSPKFDKG
ncbi:MAG: hypothetical protein QN168_13060 [Armatimonadota bacterium]|nr:hypothetical protein [Armatimonadota bacterium]